MALVASGVQLPTDLESAFGVNGQKAQNAIGANYNSLKQRRLQEAGVQGLPPGAVGPNSYGANRYATSQGLDEGNLHAALGGQLGDAAYKDTLAQREYDQNTQLAEEAAALNKPSLLQQIFQGIGGVGKTAGAYYGAKSGSGGGNNVSGGGITGAPSVSLFDPNASGYGRYSGGY